MTGDADLRTVGQEAQPDPLRAVPGRRLCVLARTAYAPHDLAPGLARDPAREQLVDLALRRVPAHDTAASSFASAA